MNRNYLYLLLDAIKKNSGITKLTQNQLSHSQIGTLLNETINEGFVEFISGELRLTQLGADFLNGNSIRMKKTNKEEWIQRDFDSMIPQKDVNEIFLPSEEDLLYLDLN